MYKQGRSLGNQLKIFVPAIVALCKDAQDAGTKVWFLGRDCDVFYEAFRSRYNVGYITGLNRENAKRLQHRRKLVKWLKSIGVKPGDILIDSGYSGSIYKRIQRDNPSFFKNIRCILLTGNLDGYTGEAAFTCSSGSVYRHIILALEHSPKREVCEWDYDKRKPIVKKADPKMLYQAKKFFKGCSNALKEAIM